MIPTRGCVLAPFHSWMGKGELKRHTGLWKRALRAMCRRGQPASRAAWPSQQPVGEAAALRQAPPKAKDLTSMHRWERKKGGFFYF